MDLPSYIKRTGIRQFAKQFGFTERAVLSWRYRTRKPSIEAASKIVQGSDLTLEQIYSVEKGPINEANRG